MQRIVIEIEKNSKMLESGTEGAIEIASMMRKVEFFRVIYYIREPRDEFYSILQVRFMEKHSSLEEIPFLNFPWITTQILDFNSSTGIYTIFVKGNPPVDTRKSNAKPDIFPLSTEVVNDKYRITFLTNSEDMPKFIEARKTERFDLRILSVTSAKLPLGSPLDTLTNKQFNILRESYYSGYYDIPRRINSEELANKLGIANSTFVTTLRRAEKRIMSDLFGGR